MGVPGVLLCAGNACMCRYCVYVRYVTMCRYCMYVQVFLDQYNKHICSSWHIPAHSDMPTHSYTYGMSPCCRLFYRIPTDMTPTLTYLHILTDRFPVAGGIVGPGHSADGVFLGENLKLGLQTILICSKYKNIV